MQKSIMVFFGLYAAALQTSMAAMEIGAWALFVLFLISFVRARMPWSELKIGTEIPFVLFVIPIIIGAIRAPVPFKEALDFVGWTRWILLLYAFYFLFRHNLKLSWEKGHRFWLVVSIIASIYAFMQFEWGIELIRRHEDLDPLGSHWRAMGFFNLCLTFAYEIGMVGLSALALALINARQEKKCVAIFAAIAYVAVGIAIMATLTRGAWLAFAIASSIVVLVFSPRRGVPVVVAAMVTAAVMIAVVPALHDRFLSIFNTTSDVSNSLRLLIWKTNWMIFKDHPIIGVGLAQNTRLAPEYYAMLGQGNVDFTSHAHNNILEFLSCIGLVGTIGYLWFSVFFIIKGFQLYMRAGWDHAWFKAIGLGSLGAQLYFHVGGMTECNFVDAEVNHTLIFIWAITLGALAIVNREKRNA
jgi:O-antigen ligase